MPLNSSKLEMLVEENVIKNPEGNALVEVFKINPTPLNIGLRELADLFLEQSDPQRGQLGGDLGVGLRLSVQPETSVEFADIRGRAARVGLPGKELAGV